jgi:hypothetical protein
MNLKKTVAIATAAGALAAISVPAMAFENEFHGMYRAFGYFTNAYSGGSGADSFNLANKSGTDKFIEQRARIQYIAKASDDLKLVTHFELDTKFGGGNTSSKYVGTDGGGLDADRLTLETKSVYLDFNCPITGANVKVGVQPYNDSFGGLFGNFDATGVTLTKKFNALTASYGYFTVGQSDTNGTGFSLKKGSSATAQDLNAIDLKFAVNKDLSVGASYYLLLDKTGDAGSATVANNTVGLNAAGKVGPVALSGVVGLQFGKSNTQTQVSGALPATGGYTSLTNNGSTALAASLAAKVAVGPGSVNLSALYLSGDPTGTGYNKAWQPIGNGVTYFTPANMWLLTRNAATINSSTSIGATSDLTRGGRGLKGLFAGYEGAVDKVFYNANVGYAAVDKKQAANSSSIGTEVNLTVGYKLFANMSASATAAYAILGDGYGKENVVLLDGTNNATKYDNPFLTAIQLNYAF